MEELLNQIRAIIDQAIHSVTDPITNTVSQIRDTVSTLTSGAVGTIRSGINYVTDVNNGLVRDVRAGIDGAIGATRDVITNTVTGARDFVRDKISEGTNALSNAIGATRDFVRDRINDGVNMLRDGQNAVRDFVSNGITAARDYISERVNATADTIRGAIDYGTSLVRDGLSNARTSIEGYIRSGTETVVNKLNGIVSDVWTNITNGLSPIANAINSVKDSIFEAFTGGIRNLSNSLADFIRPIAEGIAGGIATIRQLLNAFTETLIPQLVNNVSELLTFITELPDNATNYLETFINSLLKRGGDKLAAYRAEHIGLFLNQIHPLIAQIENSPKLPPALRRLTAPGAPPNDLAYWLLIAASVPMIYANMAGFVAEESLTQLQYEIRASDPQRVHSPDVLAALVNAGIMDWQDAANEARKSGLSAERFVKLIDAGKQTPTLDTLLEMLNRGFIDRRLYDLAVRRNAIHPDFVDAYLRLGDRLPPLTDIIAMAVKEAFTPSIAEKFGQYEDYPQQLTALARQQGISEEWARRYWAAHWDLPSPSQGFEMFQRRVIDRDTLIQLLRALDVMPFWRDKLIQISYNPLTRVDVRRMHQLGVLTPQEVESSYLDAGYSPENAKRLAEFTVKYNDGELDDARSRDKDLTKTEITTAYKDKLIDASTYRSMILALGYDERETAVIVGIADYQLATAERKDKIDALTARYKAREIDRAAYAGGLAALNLPAYSIDAYLAKADLADTAKVKRPSDGELDKMYFWKVLSEDEYRQALLDSGYSNYWVDKIVRLRKAKTKE